MTYLDYIEKNKDLQIEMLQDLVAIKSIVTDPVASKDGEVFPFGAGVQEVFACFLKKAQELGFETKNVDNYGGHVDFGHGEETVGILGHLDVVPEGDGWSFDAYSGAVSDGFIYGRGTQDDKGPLVAALFAMKALKDAGYTPAKKVRLILGLDEETQWDGMRYYFDKEPMPDYGFTPDGEFPAINGEKGSMTFEVAKKFSKVQGGGLTLRSLSGGAASNMVAEKARAVVNSDNADVYADIRELAKNYREETGYKLKVKGVGRSLEITAEGKSAHGATPEAGLSAVSIMMEFLGKLNFAGDDFNVFLDFYNKHIGFDVNGQRMGCGFSDEVSGKLTLNAGVIHGDTESVTLKINIRYPVSCSEDKVYEGVMPIVDSFDMGLIKLGGKPAIYMAPDSPLIKTLVEVYRHHSGDTESEPMVIGGATYAKAAKNVVAFGGIFPGDEDRMHQKDERLEIKRLMQMTRIYADAIYKMTQPDFTILEEGHE